MLGILDSVPTGPDLPEQNGIQRNDQHLLGLADELVQFSNVVRDHCGEGRTEKAYTALYDVLGCCQTIMHGFPFFQPVRATTPEAVTNAPISPDLKEMFTNSGIEIVDLPQPDESAVAPRPPSLEMVHQLYKAGQIEEAYQELEEVLYEVVELIKSFTFESSTTAEQYGKV